MRVVRVLTNQTCNQSCAFCNTRRDRETPETVRGASGRIDEARESGARELVLTGGEPTLRADLPELIRRAKSRPDLRVTLETNGARVDEERAEALADAGLDVARVHLPAWGADCDAITGEPGGFARTLAGLHAFHGAGIELQIAVPIARSNLGLVAELPAKLSQHGPPVRSLSVSIPTSGPDPSSIARTAECASAIAALAEAARREGLTLHLGDNGFLPPCVFAQPGRFTHLYTLSPGGAERRGFEKVEACQACVGADRCPGFPAERLALEPTLAASVKPLAEDRLRRRLSVIGSVEEQIARELVSREVFRSPGNEAVPTYTVRVNFRCNQACDFCFVSTHLPAPDPAAVRAAILEAGAAGATLALSGGEPTLNPHLEEYIRLAKTANVREVELQTNATRLAEPGLLDGLLNAGVTTVFISLHGSTAAICEAVTAAPGTFESTLSGIDAAYRAPVVTRLNFVFCQANHEDFPNVVELVAARWPKAELTLSFVAPSTDLVPRTSALIPRYQDVMPQMKAGLERARERGVRVTGFESMCGLPLCLVPEGLDQLLTLSDVPPGIDQGEFEKPAPCQECGAASRCFGLRRGYAELYGTSELRPINATDGGPPHR